MAKNQRFCFFFNTLRSSFKEEICINGLTTKGNAWRLGTGLIKRKSSNGYKQRTVKNSKFQLQFKHCLRLFSIYMVSTLQVALNLYLPGPPRKIHLKKCIFTFSENVTNKALIVGVQNVNEERTTFVIVFI